MLSLPGYRCEELAVEYSGILSRAQVAQISSFVSKNGSLVEVASPRTVSETRDQVPWQYLSAPVRQQFFPSSSSKSKQSQPRPSFVLHHGDALP